jgi:thiosulfate dehydrogenase
MISFSLLALVILIGLFTYKPPTDTIEFISYENPAVWDANKFVLNNPDVSKQVKRGYLLIAKSSKFMGPLAEEKSLQFAGNNLSCTNCHLNGGTLSGSASWIGIVERFPQFGGRANAIGTLEDRINGCMERSMNGKKFPPDAPQIQAMIAYMEWLDEGIPKINEKDFKGYPNIKLPDQAVNLNKGKEIYKRECMLCHGLNGQGVRYLNEEDGYQYPPLWGKDSYNNGAGMHRVITAAAFIKNNMPYLQARWDNPKLSDEEAYHVAGYINSFDRPIKQNTEDDYPDKKLKPISTPYGPWVDSFSPDQHKYGPFPPIISFYKEEYNLSKTK